ncbi:MAG: winged helix-turn-helix domain-containing protein [Pseudomonadales bacterium]|nr:winged helix-turn-helix domain-containing protein [Pseudomonadales bacterium]NRA17099.1 winged helix-turn-helix transcriptional regulator [Oceanospirillaceae bacterium]
MQPDIAVVAGLIGETTRARMLTALMGGKALTATELAVEADITAQTASSHLNKLVTGQLLVVRKQGRHKYFQLKGPQIAALLEALLNISNDIASAQPPVATGPADPRLRTARVCYDHLAGGLSVKLYDSLLAKNFIAEECERVELTARGQDFFAGIGASIAPGKSKRALCKSCLDWSERRSHLAGIAGQWVLNDLFKQGWARKDLDSRAVQFTQQGLRLFRKKYAIDA